MFEEENIGGRAFPPGKLRVNHVFLLGLEPSDIGTPLKNMHTRQSYYENKYYLQSFTSLK